MSKQYFYKIPYDILEHFLDNAAYKGKTVYDFCAEQFKDRASMLIVEDAKGEEEVQRARRLS